MAADDQARLAQPAMVLTLVVAREAGVLSTATIDRVREAVRCASAAVVLSDGEAVDLAVDAPHAPEALVALAETAVDGAAIDVLAGPADLGGGRGRRRMLLVADMDGTIITGEMLDELAAFAGVGDQVAAITRRSMSGEMEFAVALRERAALLAGLSLEALEKTWRGARLTAGARTLVATMRASGARTALVSGGFSYFSERVAASCGFDEHHANVLLDDGWTLTGAVAEPILGRETKLAILLGLAGRHGIDLGCTMAVGDGANDMAMLLGAGLGIAFHATPMVTTRVHNRVKFGDLRALLFAQGYHAREFQED